MTKDTISFVASAKILKVLGGLMIKDHTTGIMELIKNGFDADAENVHVTVRNPTVREQTQVIIEDDGTGMTDKEVRGPWATAATDTKLQNKNKNKRTAKGRTPLGEKGVGRFAAEKLGKYLKLITKTADSDTEIVISVNWDDFDDGKKSLDSIPLTIEHVAPKQFVGGKHGTYLRMTGPDSKITKKDMEALQASLLRLLAPDREYSDFDVKLECNEWPDVQDIDSTALWNTVTEKFQFKLVCDIMDNGKMKHDFWERNFEKPEDIREDTGKTDPWAQISPENFNTGKNPACGKFRITFYCWLLNAAKVLTPLGITKEEIDHLSGISLYRDGFRVIPYGDKGNDWLNLNLARVQAPGKSLSSNQIIGLIEIDQTNNTELVDKSSREGLVENQAYFDMHKFAKNALLMLQNEMKPTREKLSNLAKQKKKINTELETLKEQNKMLMEKLEGLEKAYTELAKMHKPKDAPEVKGEFKTSAKLVAESNKTIKKVERGVKKLSGLPEYELAGEKRRNLLVHLMTLGHMVEGFVAEYSRHVGSMRKNLESLNEKSPFNESVKAALNIAKIFDDDMKSAVKGRYEMKEGDSIRVDDVIKSCIDSFSARAEKGKVKIDYADGSGLETKMEFHQLYKVLFEIIANAVYWAKTNTELSKRTVKITVEKDVPSIIVSNEGPEIPQHLRKSSLNDFESTTTKPVDGTLGMGLWLSHQTIKEYNGEIVILDEEDELFRKDACFMIRLGC